MSLARHGETFPIFAKRLKQNMEEEMTVGPCVAGEYGSRKRKLSQSQHCQLAEIENVRLLK